MTPKRLTLTLSSLAALLLAALAALTHQTRAAQAAPAPDTAAVNRLYLPVVFRSPALLYGRVTESGAAAAGVTVSLRFYNGASWSTLATAGTGSDGHYQFLGQPALGVGQRYQVTFDNTAGHDGRLAWWGTRQVTKYDGVENVHLGDFDIAAVQLAEPAHQATAELPATFRWYRRGVSGDNYALRLYDQSDFNPLYVSPYVGDTDRFTLSSLPGGFQHGTAYTWDVILLAADGATGVSRQVRSVRLSNGLFGRLTQQGSAVGGVALQLRFYNGFNWSTIASTTTASDGSYAFSSAPTLGAGQKYYVRYENVTQTAGRLFLWSTRALTSYTAGSAVDLGAFDIADVTLVAPASGTNVALPGEFRWTRRPATPTDSYLLELYDPSDYAPRWLSPVLGYAESHLLSGLAPAFATGTPYAWDVIITSPDGGSGVSRLARLVAFTNRGAQTIDGDEAEWPFDEELPPRLPGDIEGGELLELLPEGTADAESEVAGEVTNAAMRGAEANAENDEGAEREMETDGTHAEDNHTAAGGSEGED